MDPTDSHVVRALQWGEAKDCGRAEGHGITELPLTVHQRFLPFDSLIEPPILGFQDFNYHHKSFILPTDASKTCLKQMKPCRDTRAPSTPIVRTQPFELVTIDFRHLDECKGGYEQILAIVDHYTCFAQVFATTLKFAKTVADNICNDFPLKFDFSLIRWLCHRCRPRYVMKPVQFLCSQDEQGVLVHFTPRFFTPTVHCTFLLFYI